jgi:hypothetical protein
LDEYWKTKALLAYQYKKLPTELSSFKVSELADALKSLEFALKEIEKNTPQNPMVD